MLKETKDFPFYVGKPEAASAETPLQISQFERNRTSEVSAYVADDGLAAAVNVALVLGQPLLLTGEPGSGKTQLAYSLGRELGYDVLKFETKSTSVARDLFYSYDTLRRFHDAQLQRPRNSTEYLSYNALGTAIIRSRHRWENNEWLNDSFDNPEPRRSIVLIDEIDKAPRDFPNDLLNEVELMYFRIPEIGICEEVISAHENLRPIVIITSNSEKSLPDPFLRRCIFYNIPFPDPKRLSEIVLSHMSASQAPNPKWLDQAIDFFVRLRQPEARLDKRPSTAELLNWLNYLKRAGMSDEAWLRADKKKYLSSSLSALFKTTSDQDRATQILEDWLSKQPNE
jgi:MoxR-like ATPase